MSQTLSARLETVEVDEPVEAGGLQVFALHRDPVSRWHTPRWTTAWRRGCWK